MFLWGYFGVLFSAILLWIITIRVTKDEQGLDWWDCLRWVAGAYVAGLAVRVLCHVVHLPDVVGLVLQIIVGLTVLDRILAGQFGGEQALRIVIYYAGIRVLFALPFLLMWYLSRN